MARLAARRAAMQLVYEQLLGGEGGEHTLDELIQFSSDDEADAGYIQGILEGVQQHQEELDGQIARRSTSRELNRIPYVIRAVLRLAIYELLYLKDSPESAIINEAVELAKRFGEESDGRFVNGVLGSIVRDRPPA